MPGPSPYLIVNPRAGRGRAGQRADGIVEHLRKAGFEPRLHASTGPGDIEQSLVRLAPDGKDTVIVAGGDGSVHEAVNGLLSSGSEARLAVIPVGTGNDFAKATGVPLDWQRATTELTARLLQDGPFRRIDAGRFNNRYFANGAGVGFDAVVTRIARSYTVPMGDVVYLLAVLQALKPGVASPAMRIVGETELWHGPLTLANVANGPYIGGMFHIAPHADPGDGVLDLVIAEPVTRRRVLALLPQLVRGRHLAAPEVHDFRSTHLHIETAEPVASHLDGEVQEPQCLFEIEVLPSALRLA